MKYVALACLSFGLAACGSMNNALLEKTKSVEYYRIFDIKTKKDKDDIIEAASNGLGQNVNNAQEARPIPSGADLPEKPGRFKVVNPFEGSAYAAYAGASGQLSLKMATCDGAAWMANAQRDVAGQSSLRLTACLFQYKSGYHLDMYATFTKQEGGLMEISRQAAGSLVGTPEEWTEKTFLDVVRQIQKETGATFTLVEGYPKVKGTPWLDK